MLAVKNIRMNCALAAVLIAGVAFAAQGGVGLKRKPTKGDVAEYAVTGRFEIDAGTINYAAKRVDKVLTVKPDGGYTVESSTSNIAVDVGGRVVNAVDYTTTTVFLPRAALRR